MCLVAEDVGGYITASVVRLTPANAQSGAGGLVQTWPVRGRRRTWENKIKSQTFSGFSVGSCINEEKVIWYQL